jgi:hypothetical protein
MFQPLKLKIVSRKYWFDMLGSEMAKVMHVVLLEVTKMAFAVSSPTLQLM